MFTTEGHPMPVNAMSQRRQSPPHAQQPPGNATLHTLHTHPFYRARAASPWLPSASTAAAAADPLTWTHGLVTEARMEAQVIPCPHGCGIPAVVAPCIAHDAGA